MNFVSIKIFTFFTFLLGILYPLVMTGISQVIFYEKANGSLITKNKIAIGSELIGQDFKAPYFFHGRPSVVDYNSLSSAASNFSQTSRDFNIKQEDRKKEGLSGSMLTTSGSGLDPHITLLDAFSQIQRITSSQPFNSEDAEKFVNECKFIILKTVEKRTFGFLGEERVNVLKLNRELQLILTSHP